MVGEATFPDGKAQPPGLVTGGGDTGVRQCVDWPHASCRVVEAGLGIEIFEKLFEALIAVKNNIIG